MSNPDDPRSWMQKLEEDLLAIDSMLAGKKIPWAVVAFHAQQAGEKALKALLVKHGDTVPLTHDLEALALRCGQKAVALPQLMSDCNFLTPFAVANRYPGVPNPDEAEGRSAVAAANRIVDEVRKLL